MPSTSDLNQSAPLDGATDAATPVFLAQEFLATPGTDLVARVQRACLETGFLIIEPTSDMSATIASTVGRMQEFFLLDDDDRRKQDVRQDDSRRGWRPRFTEPAYQPGTKASLEAFDLGVDEIRSRQARAWPAVPAFSDTVSRCWDDFLHLADAVLAVVGRAAGLDEQFLNSRCQTRELNSFRLLHYAGGLAASNDQDVGIAAHTDFECITLLYQDTPGLELRTTGDQWIDAVAGVGRIVVMLDDMIERWTNGYFSATGHRVRQTGHQRFSIVMFMAVDDGVTIAPLEQFVSGDNPPRYEPVTQAAHLAAEIRRARSNAAADSG